MSSSEKFKRSREPLESQEAKRPRQEYGNANHFKRDARTAAIQEAQHMQEWLSKEDDFVLKQAKKRAAIRVRESRAKPIDFLAVNLRFVDAERDPTEENELEEVEVHPKDPLVYLPTLHQQELEELSQDLDEFYKLEVNKSNRDYWRSLLTVCTHLKQSTGTASKKAASRTVSNVASEVERILQNKTVEQLHGLGKAIKNKLESNTVVDVEYWEQLEHALQVKLAWTKLEAMYKLILGAASEESKRKQIVFKKGKREVVDAPKKVDPAYQGPNKSAAIVVKASEKDFESAAARLYKQEANQELQQDEELFNKEASVPERVPKWKHKHPDITPRKPKYFNRVQTGFEWTSYNKVHYNEENPPPKIVYGYRFNIFYPDLIDQSKAPQYKIERQADRKSSTNIGEDLCIIRFTAGAPYEDVCFEIVDKDWDHSSRYDRGFRSSFDKGILQLHFKFKRISYRK